MSLDSALGKAQALGAQRDVQSGHTIFFVTDCNEAIGGAQ
jgi:hypothetical protein